MVGSESETEREKRLSWSCRGWFRHIVRVRAHDGAMLDIIASSWSCCEYGKSISPPAFTERSRSVAVSWIDVRHTSFPESSAGITQPRPNEWVYATYARSRCDR